MAQTTFAERTSPLTQRERTAHYGGGYWVIAGTRGDLAYSTDSVNWTKITPFTTDVIIGCCYGNGKWVVAGSTGELWVSDKPTSGWTLATNLGRATEHVAFGNSRFVAVGEAGKIAYSDNGTAWTSVSVEFTENLNAVCYGGGLFVAVGNGGLIASSPDGITWTDRTTASITGPLRCVTYRGGTFVLGGQSGVTAYSKDAVTWTLGSNNTTSTVNYIRAIVYASGKYIAVMYVSTGGGEVWESADGATWAVNNTTAGRLWCAATNGISVVMSGDNGKIYALETQSGSSGGSSHYTLIDGTLYVISSGRTLVNGTGYSIDKGKTLVGGTAYEVGFGVPVTIKLTGKNVGNVEYNGVQYTAPSEFEADIGDEIFVKTIAVPRGSTIYLNGNVVATGSGGAEYTYTVACGVIIDFQQSGSSYNVSLNVYITEE